MSEINKLTVNGKTYDLADAALRQQLDAVVKATGGFPRLYDFQSEAKIAAYLKVNGTSVANAYYKCTDFLPVKTGERIRYKLMMGAAVAMICFYTSPGKEGFVSCVAGTGKVEEGVYVAPGDGWIVACTENYQSSVPGYLYSDVVPDLITALQAAQQEKINGDLAEQSRKIDDVKAGIFSLYSDGNINAYLGNEGLPTANAFYKTTQPIYVKAGITVRYKLKHDAKTPVIALYSDPTPTNSNMIDAVLGNGGVLEGEYTTPSEGFIRFCENASHTGGYVCFTDTVPDNVRRYVENRGLGSNILCLGDSIFGNDGQIVEYLSELTGTKVVRGAIGGTQVSVRPYNSDPFRYLDGQNLVQALVSGNWTDQDSAVASLQGTYTWLPERIATLKELDMSSVDLVIMNWGTNDYTGGRATEEICAAYGSVIDALQSAYPQLRILITTPIWRYWSDTENSDNKIYNGDTLKQIAKAIENLAKDKRISVLNAYENMPLSYNTAATYFDENDKTHLNAKGNMLYAHLLNGKIRSLY